MATEPDPYRTLGLTPTASLAEVKAAYRRLAKVNHPDAAGETALPRFLAIQAAYERLVGPAPDRPRAPAGSARSPRKPWEADPDRRDATYRAYGGRSKRASPKSTGSPKSNRSGGSTESAESTGSAGSGPSNTAGSGRASRSPKKATLGSTSYDGTDRETFEPDWGGASWYGTTSGTYWTINPKEYADPRKHGPEYQARARRAAHKGVTGDDVIEDAAEPLHGGVEAEANPRGPVETGPGAAAAADTDPGSDAGSATPRHATSSWWESTSGAAAAAREASTDPTPPPPRHRSNPPWVQQGIATSPSMSDARRALAVGRPPSVGWRIARALIAWLPIALAIGWAVGEFTGCGRYAATCDPRTAPIAGILQAAALVALFALPVIAGWGVVAAGACLVVAVPTTLFVTASAGAEASRTGTAFLGGVLGITWLAAFGWAALHGRRSTPDTTRPVS